MVENAGAQESSCETGRLTVMKALEKATFLKSFAEAREFATSPVDIRSLKGIMNFLYYKKKDVDRLEVQSSDNTHLSSSCGTGASSDPSSPANKKKTLAINTGLGGLSKRGSPICTLKRASASKIEEELAGRLIVYTDGSVIPDTGSATASCVMPALVWTASCHLLFAACSTAAQTAGLHMAVDLLAANSPTCPVAVACDSRAASLALAEPEREGFATQVLVTKLHALLDSGVDVSLHWVPSHVGIQRNEQASCRPGERSISLRHPCVPYRGRLRLFEAHIEEAVAKLPP
ncbi:hypothetical protein HPB51_003407 [Rhipicephalus microplus]|uniref:RNase H type-1 domain-containing protein n=1 Tax=Rhipicephalus microplus TaxID=6941 RepID=A0A9J6DFP1_RHIMP|nr:hypothetical protein HPB51_003407 [Rhipicephalus microplus]